MARETDEIKELCEILNRLKRQVMRRAISAHDRSPETFGEEIVALNNIDQAIRNNCG